MHGQLQTRPYLFILKGWSHDGKLPPRDVVCDDIVRNAHRWIEPREAIRDSLLERIRAMHIDPGPSPAPHGLDQLVDGHIVGGAHHGDPVELVHQARA